MINLINYDALLYKYRYLYCICNIGNALGIDTALAGDPEATSKKGAAERTDCPLILPD